MRRSHSATQWVGSRDADTFFPSNHLSDFVFTPGLNTIAVELHQSSDDDLMQRLTAYNKAMVEEVSQFTPERAYRRMAENRVNNQ